MKDFDRICVEEGWNENLAGCAMDLRVEALNFLDLFVHRGLGSFLGQAKNEGVADKACPDKGHKNCNHEKWS